MSHRAIVITTKRWLVGRYRVAYQRILRADIPRDSREHRTCFTSYWTPPTSAGTRPRSHRFTVRGTDVRPSEVQDKLLLSVLLLKYIWPGDPPGFARDIKWDHNFAVLRANYASRVRDFNPPRHAASHSLTSCNWLTTRAEVSLCMLVPDACQYRECRVSPINNYCIVSITNDSVV